MQRRFGKAGFAGSGDPGPTRAANSQLVVLLSSSARHPNVCANRVDCSPEESVCFGSLLRDNASPSAQSTVPARSRKAVQDPTRGSASVIVLLPCPSTTCLRTRSVGLLQDKGRRDYLPVEMAQQVQAPQLFLQVRVARIAQTVHSQLIASFSLYRVL